MVRLKRRCSEGGVLRACGEDLDFVLKKSKKADIIGTTHQYL